VTIRIHPTADVSPEATVGDGTSVWQQVQIRGQAAIGNNCILGKGVFIDREVSIGSNVKIQNYVSVYQGVTIEDGVLVGPHVCFTNDLRPRAVNPDGSLKSMQDWTITPTLIREGATLGANSTIVCGTTIGRWAMVGAGGVVTKDVPDYGLIRGNPARLRGFVGPSGEKLVEYKSEGLWMITIDPATEEQIKIPLILWEIVKNDIHS
jgi:UDP-2-acetamido-3-amino-2,3-dideoxy-glucuronate N-acetyltransferase